MSSFPNESEQQLDLKSKSFSDVKASFFDDDDDDVDFELLDTHQLWIKPHKSHLNLLKAKNILCEGFLSKKGQTIKRKEIRYYVLTPEFLAYQEKQEGSNIKKLILLERTKLEFYTKGHNTKSPKYGFCFQRNRTIAKIYTRDKDIYDEFKTHLSRLCVLSSFLIDYKTMKMIGKGSYGKVYLIEKQSDKSLYAAKVFQKHILLSEKKGKSSLINEIRILRKLTHPGIMKLYEVHETSLTICLVLELLEGGELFERLDTEKKFSENDCALMLRKIIEPLIYMHQNEVMHRDIKPENLVLRSKSNEYDIVLADFGLAQEAKKKFIHIRCGTPGYCAPEVLLSKPNKPEYDLKVDVFSVGCLFYQMITGNLPFIAKNLQEMFEANKKSEISFDHVKIQALSQDAQSLLRLMLAKEVSKRPSFAECLNHKFFFEANKRASEVVFSFVHQSLFFGTKLSQQSKTDVNEKKPEKKASLSEDLLSFVFGKPNMIRGRLDTVEEMTIVTSAVGVQNMLGLNLSNSPIMIQTKLTQKLQLKQTSEIKTMTTNVQTKVFQEELNGDVENVQDCSLKSSKSNLLDEERKAPEGIGLLNDKKKREKAEVQMMRLASQIQPQMQNPFTYFDNTHGK